MRVSGRKLRLAVGMGMAALMLVLGVGSVGASAPLSTGGIFFIITGSGASAYHSPNPNTTVASYRNAPTVTNGDLNGLDECVFTQVGNVTNATTTSAKDVSGCIESDDQVIVLQPASPWLWLVVGGPGVSPSGKYLVVPETENKPNGTLPGQSNIIETFR